MTLQSFPVAAPFSETTALFLLTFVGAVHRFIPRCNPLQNVPADGSRLSKFEEPALGSRNSRPANM
jgi:hypothetical protein